MTDYAYFIAQALDLKPAQVSAAIQLFDDGGTIPFIARYRKEATGSLDEEQLRQVQTLLTRQRALDERRAAVIASIEEQGRMTPELLASLNAAENLTALEDLYAPYKPKRRTRASIAREKGLEKLAEAILRQLRISTSIQEYARPFLNEQVPSVEEALAGARDIVAEIISDHAGVRQETRRRAMQWGVLQSAKIPDAVDDRAIYQSYYEFEQRVDRLRPHQVLALNRGENQKVLRVSVIIAQRDWENAIFAHFLPDNRSPFASELRLAIADGAERLLLPAIERDVRRSLTETAEAHAIRVFAANLRALLLHPPIEGHTVLGIDPGYRTGCKVAVVDPTGKVLATGTIYPHEPQKKWRETLEILTDLVTKFKVTLITLGNGTASRETEQLAAELVKQMPHLRYLITNEAGASVYSASPLARAELPELDVSLRGAVSIARRVQDPLAELVKIDPKSIGVGLYQHDVDQNRLAETLAGVVEDAVNQVGVDVNTASPALLTHVAGIGPKLAEKIVAFRDEHGRFTERSELRQVPGLGPKAFEQSAGFLRIRNGRNPLDASAIHPESYPVAEAVLKLAGVNGQHDLTSRKRALDELRRGHSIEQLADRLTCGIPTLEDIFDQLIQPGRDPRQDTPAPILRTDIVKMEDLQPGMRLKGTVRNVVDFGAFIDIGVKQDGLLHRSQLPPGTFLEVGQVVEVIILQIEIERGRISLGMN